METLMRVLAKRDFQGDVYGTLLLDGNVPGKDFKQFISYVPKYEVVLPTITVQETLLASYRLRLDESVSNENIFFRMLLILKVFGLLRVRQTIVGDTKKIRGISGGERRRLSFCQEFAGFSSVLLAELPTNGLDSATAYNLCKSVRDITEALSYSVVFTLAQPAPELLNLFDNLLLLSKGRQIYFGPVCYKTDDMTEEDTPKDAALEYFQNMGFIKPELKSVPDFYQELTGDPSNFYDPDKDNRDRLAQEYPDECEAGTWEDLAEAWKRSDLFKELGTTMWKEFAPENVPKKERMPLRPTIRTGAKTQLATLAWRQWHTVLRNTQFSFARLGQAVMQGLMLGSVFFDLGTNNSDMMAMFSFLFLITLMCLMMTIPTIPFMVDLRDVHVFQSTSHYYYRPMFYCSVLLIEVFWLIPQTFIFALISYPMVGMQGNVVIGERWIFFWLVVVVLDNTSRAIVLVVTSAAGNSEKAHAILPAFFYLFIVSAGYLTPYSQLNSLWTAIYYVNPSAYGWKALVVNQMYDLTYDGTPYDISGAVYMDTLYDIDPDSEDDKWGWFAIMILLWASWHVIGVFFTSLNTEEVYRPSMMITDYKGSMAPKREPTLLERIFAMCFGSPNQDVALLTEEVTYQAMEAKELEKVGIPITITWDKLNYRVHCKDPDTGKMYWKHILHDVFGYTKPGNMIALMGATGAGKSTLMDVLADYKTGGEITGEILINGHERNPFFPYVAGYVEQFDSHEESMTVREAIEFSSLMRLPVTMSDSERALRVTEVLEKLELLPISNVIIGNDFEGGISPEYRKKVTIGVELIMDPGLLFLDEPTTGLDSASAYSVMTTVKNLASNMSVVCTIHQPSKEVFAVFDTMMLLRAGGFVCYFGPVDTMAEYFEGIGFPKYNPVQNLADYALECSHNQRGMKTDVKYRQSGRYIAAMDEMKSINMSDDAIEPTVDLATRPGCWRQFKALLARFYRKVAVVERETTGVRFMTMLFSSLLLGWVFFDLDKNQSGAISRTSICFMSISLTGFTAQQAIPPMFRARPYIFRETKSGMYTMTPWVLARLMMDFPITIVESVFFVIPLYFMVGFEGDFGKFWLAWFISYQAIIGSVELAASLVSTQELADATCALLNASCLIFAGFLVQYEALPVYWVWAYWISPIHYGFNAILSNEFENIGDIESEEGEPVYYETGDDVIDAYNADQLDFEQYLLVMIGIILVWRLIYILVSINVQHIKR